MAKIADVASKKMVESGIIPLDIAAQLDKHLKDFHSNAQTKNDQ